MTRDRDYDLPAGPLDTVLEMTMDGVVFLLERVEIERLPEFRARHHLRAVGPIGGPNTWPPAILYQFVGEKQ